jgi:threonylcarbamoyladenosine tRNA methylthiotransferase MtaB
MSKFTITTLGCKVNQYESETIAAALEKSGWTSDAQTADIELCIINTCAVTRKASMQSRQAVRQAVKAHPRARILVTGCYAQTEPEALKKIAGISCVVGHAAKHSIPDMLTAATDRTEPLAAPDGFNLAKTAPFRESALTVGKSRTRPFLKIQDGCNAFCSYCIVPYARGRSRSMPFESVIQNICRLAQAGFHEVVLCGVHLGCYGLDLTPPTRLFEILRQVDADALIDRVRLSSIEPREISDEIIKLTAASEHMCHHFHIPLQSGDNMILERMHRPYTRSFFR